MLEVRQLNATYGQHPALQDVGISVSKGEIVVILGANGAGKSTLLRAVAGICEGKVTGEIRLSGTPLLGLSSDRIVSEGLALVPEGRGIFADLTVEENLLLGAYTAKARSRETENLDRVLTLFPKLAERKKQVVRTMSGGEQQMVAIGRAMMSAPDILMLDEPSLGLAPLLCTELFQSLSLVKELNIGILLVEQNAKQSLAIADRGYLLENTRITLENSADALSSDPAVQRAYLGGSSVSTEKIQPPRISSASHAASESHEPMHSIDVQQSIGEIRRTADQQIGGSIDELVSVAAHQSEQPPNHKTTSSSAKILSVKQVDRVTLDIEKAALEARQRAGRRVSSRSSRSSLSNRSVAVERRGNEDQQEHNAIGAGSSEAPVVIEVYKRPRVEVYRRRPSGDFERT